MGISSITGQPGVAPSFHISNTKNKDSGDSFLTALKNSNSSTSTKPDVEVTLSQDAMRLSAGQLPGWVQEQADKFRSDPDQDQAMRAVEQLSTTQGGALLSYAPDSDGIHGVYYAATGKPVTPENKARFESISQSIATETTNIFYSERAKGTSAADIFEKINQFMSSQPNDYLQSIKWFSASLDQFD